MTQFLRSRSHSCKESVLNIPRAFQSLFWTQPSSFGSSYRAPLTSSIRRPLRCLALKLRSLGIEWKSFEQVQQFFKEEASSILLSRPFTGASLFSFGLGLPVFALSWLSCHFRESLNRWIRWLELLLRQLPSALDPRSSSWASPLQAGWGFQ